MGRIVIIFVFLFSTSSWAFEEPPVRVRLQKTLSELRLSVFDLRIRGVTEREERALAKVFIEIKRRLDEEKKYYWEISFLRNKNSKLKRKYYGAELEISASIINSGPVELPHVLKLSPNSQNPFRFDVIGLVSMTSYLVGVLGSEMPLTWPEESLKAQLIAARSYTIASLRERVRKDFDVESDINDQVFRHIRSFELGDQKIKKAARLVQETRGLVLKDIQGQVIRAYYHADCGGETVDAKRVWGVKGYGTAKDPYCAERALAEWSLVATKEALFPKVAKVLGLVNAAEITSIDPVYILGSTRVESLKVKLKDERRLAVNSNNFREVIGYEKLRSARFEIDKISDGDFFVFRGRGAGHGVGLCQFGSKALAELGKTSSEILAHYYPKANLRALY